MSWSSIRQILAYLWLVPLALLSLLSVFRAPFYGLWKPAVGVIEWFHIIILLVLIGCLFPDPKSKSAWLLWSVAAIAIGLLLSPWFRATTAAPKLQTIVESRFGTQSLANASRPEQPASQESPLSLGRLFASTGRAPIQTHQVVVSKDTKLPLDLYQEKETKQPQPLAVVLHGGAWAGGDRTQISSFNHYLATRGWSVAAISYRLSPTHTYPTHLNDVTAMLKWLKENAKTLNIDPEHIVLIGRSAGGHLALLAAYKRVVKGIRGVISFYAPTDLMWSWNNPANPLIIDTHGTLTDFLGGPLTSKEARYKDASPLHQVTDKAPPTLLLHGGRDELVSPRQSERLSEALTSRKIPHAVVHMPWASHGCEANLFGPSGQLSMFAVERFLRFTQKK